MSKSKTKKSNSKRLRTKSCLRNWSIFVPRMLIKKLQALVEERIVRESGKEPKPSKD